MSVQVQPAVSDQVIVYNKRRGTELALILFAQTFGFGGWIITNLNLYGDLPDNLIPVACIWFGMGIAAHLIVRFKLPYADPLILHADATFANAAARAAWARLGAGPFAAVSDGPALLARRLAYQSEPALI